MTKTKGYQTVVYRVVECLMSKGRVTLNLKKVELV